MDERLLLGVGGLLSICIVTGCILWCIGKFL